MTPLNNLTIFVEKEPMRIYGPAGAEMVEKRATGVSAGRWLPDGVDANFYFSPLA